ncbi:MAG: hypothetical protein IJH85_04515, partial [Clostridia bacterium]|nr:hypothetical protein [Clostridia bacterium]
MLWKYAQRGEPGKKCKQRHTERYPELNIFSAGQEITVRLFSRRHSTDKERRRTVFLFLGRCKLNGEKIEYTGWKIIRNAGKEDHLERTGGSVYHFCK